VTFRYQPAECPDWMFPAVAYSPDGRLLLTGGRGPINAPCWSPDGKRFAYVRYAPAAPK
jgi:WD40 repeat protein